MKKMMLVTPFLFAAALAVAQPGPGPTPNPWVVNGSTISYSTGCVLVPATVTGGCKGVGTINASGLYVNGVSAVNSVTSVFGRTGAVVATSGDYSFSLISGTLLNAQLVGNYTGLTGTGTLTSGVWNATAIGSQYGGLGLNNSAASGVPLATSGTFVMTGTSGSGNFARVTSPTFVTPTLGAALATSINGNTITTGTGVLTLGAGKTLTASNTLTLTGTDGSSVNFGAGGTVLYSGGSYVSSLAGTANQITASGSTGAVTLSLPSTLIAPGTFAATSGAFGGCTISTDALCATGTGSFSGLLNGSGGLSTTSGTLTANFAAIGLQNVGGAAVLNLNGSTNSRYRAIFNGGTNNVQTAGASYANVVVGASPATEATSGTHPLLANLAVKAPAFTDGVATTTNTATVYVEGAPTGVTPTAGAYGLWVAGGGTRLDGALTTNVTGTANNCLQANSSGVVSGTGTACGGAGVTSVTCYGTAITSTGTCTTTGQTPGVTTNSNASAGNVGETATASVARNQTGIVSGTPTNITSISLTAGDWDVDGTVGFESATGAIFQEAFGWVSTTSATLPSLAGPGIFGVYPSSTAVFHISPTGRIRVSIASTTTVYLGCQVSWTTGSVGCYGTIQARRVR